MAADGLVEALTDRAAPARLQVDRRRLAAAAALEHRLRPTATLIDGLRGDPPDRERLQAWAIVLTGPGIEAALDRLRAQLSSVVSTDAREQLRSLWLLVLEAGVGAQAELDLEAAGKPTGRGDAALAAACWLAAALDAAIDETHDSAQLTTGGAA